MVYYYSYIKTMTTYTNAPVSIFIHFVDLCDLSLARQCHQWFHISS